MNNQFNIQEIGQLFKNQAKSDKDIEKIQQYLYGLPYFQKLFSGIHKLLIPKLIRKFHYESYEAGCAIIENGNKIKDFFIILEGSCLEMNKKKENETEHQNAKLIDNLDNSPFLRVLMQSEERKQSLLFQQTPVHSTTKNQISKLREEYYEEVQDQILPKQQLSQISLRSDQDYLFVDQYKKKYAKKGYNILNILKDGDYFGGIVKKGAEQTFSDIVCCTNIEIVCLSFDDYWNILQMYQLRMCEEKISFLRSYRFLSIYTDHYLNKRLNMFEEIQLQRNQCLFEENQKANYIYFIVKGELVMNKNVDFKQYFDNTQDDKKSQQIRSQSMNHIFEQANKENKSIENQQEKVQSHQNYKKNIIISYLNPGSYIGLSEILTSELYTYSVTCYSTEAKVFRLYISNFEDFFQCKENIEIMAEDCLCKEKIYDKILQNNANIVKEQYNKELQQNNQKSMLQTFQVNQKQNHTSSNLIIPKQAVTNRSQSQDKKLSVMDQRIQEKLKSQNLKVTKQDIQKEKNNVLVGSVISSIKHDPVFKRKLLHNLQSLGFKLNKDNCNIFKKFNKEINLAETKGESVSKQDECFSSFINKIQFRNNIQSQKNNYVSEKDELIQGNMVESQQFQKQNLKQNISQQQLLSRSRLSFVINHQESSKRQSLKRQQTNDQRDNSLNLQCRTPSIDDLKCFETNITYRREMDFKSQPTSPQARNLFSNQSFEHNIQTNFNSKTSFNFGYDVENVTTANETLQKIKLDFYPQNNRKSSLSPKQSLEDTYNKLDQVEQYPMSSSCTNIKQDIKNLFVNRKTKIQSALSNKHSNMVSKTPIEELKQEGEILSQKETPLNSPIFNQQKQITKILNRGQNSSDNEQYPKSSIQQIFTQNQSQNYFNQQQLTSFKDISTSPSMTNRLSYYNNLTQDFTQDFSKPIKIQINNVNPNKLKQNSSLNTSNSKIVQHKLAVQVKNIPFTVKGMNDKKQVKINFEQNHNKVINVHKQNNQQLSFKEKLNNLVEKHIDESHNNKKNYIIENKVDQFQPIDQSNIKFQNPKLQTIISQDENFQSSHKQSNIENINNNDQTTPKFYKIKNKKQSCVAFQSSRSYTQLSEFLDTNQAVPIQSPKMIQQNQRVHLKRSSIPIFSPNSTKITQQSTGQPSFSSFQTLISRGHSRMPSDQSCSNIIQKYVKNQIN